MHLRPVVAVVALLALLGLSACGVDGPPVAPGSVEARGGGV